MFLLGLAIGLTASLISVWFCDSASAGIGDFFQCDDMAKTRTKKIKAYRNPDHYKSPEGAVKTLVEALGENDEKKLLAIFGPDGENTHLLG